MIKNFYYMLYNIRHKKLIKHSQKTHKKLFNRQDFFDRRSTVVLK